MATPRRFWREGTIYHVTTRGNRKEDIFNDKSDYKVYLVMIEENLKYYSQFNYKLLEYCLMKNHVHLLIKTDTCPLSDFMRRLNSKYTLYYNKKYNYVGHLFQGRYYSQIIENNAQLLEVSRYIHLNPVRSKICNNPKDYIWSSYHNYIINKESKLISTEVILDFFVNRRRYREFVEHVPAVKEFDRNEWTGNI